MNRFIRNNFRLYLYTSLLFDIITFLLFIKAGNFYAELASQHPDVLPVLILAFTLLLLINRLMNLVFKLQHFQKLANNPSDKDSYYPDEALAETILDMDEEKLSSAEKNTKALVQFNLFLSVPAGFYATVTCYTNLPDLAVLHNEAVSVPLSLLILLFGFGELTFYRSVPARI